VREILEAVRSQQLAHGGWEVSILLEGTPHWAAHGPRGCERSTATAFSRPITERGLEGYRALVRSLLALGREVGVNLRWWSPWNEPNHPKFISPQRGRCDRRAPPLAPGVYARLARALREELDEAPGAQDLVLGDFAGLPHGSEKSETVTEFVAALPDDVACSARAWAVHGYADAGRPHGVPRADSVTELERELDRRPCTRDAAISVTETGAGAPHAGDERRNGAEALRDSCRAIGGLLERWNNDPRVSAAFQYTFRDDPAFPVGLADPRLQRLYPAYEVWLAWGESRRERGDPAPAVPGVCGG
jgi:hypothetical protein